MDKTGMFSVEIGSLWIGGELSWLEQLCLKSFVDAGHRTTLFTYDKVEGIPEGVHVENAADILPTDRIIRHARTGSPAYHADIFRLHLIRDSNIVWVDTDAYCLRPFTLPRSRHYHGWITDKTPLVNNGVLGLPKKSGTLRAMLAFTEDEYPVPPWLPTEKQDELRALKDAGRGVHVSLMPWGVWGPNALTHFLHETGEVEHSQPGHVLYPVPFSHKRALLKPGRRHKVEEWVTEETRSIHFWGRRFRAAASDTGGIPHPGSYTADLLARHGIDPAPTAHLMRPVQPRGEKSPAPRAETGAAGTDFSMLDDGDIFNLLLQRSSAVRDPAALRAAIAGDDGPLMREARENRATILDTVFSELRAEFEAVLPVLRDLAPRRVADIGAGYAFIDLLMFREFDCDIVLIDIEDSEDRHFGFEEEGAGYSSLSKARAFLVANGVPDGRITTINPRHESLGEAGKVDLAMSFISCGFHYPAETYAAFFRDNVTEAGGILLDIRKGSGGIPYMKSFGALSVLRKHKKLSTVFIDKAARQSAA